jgi:hypothetical protein
LESIKRKPNNRINRAIEVPCSQQSTGVAVKTAIVEKPASKDGASFHRGLCQPTHLLPTTTRQEETSVNGSEGRVPLSTVDGTHRIIVDGKQKGIAFALW